MTPDPHGHDMEDANATTVPVKRSDELRATLAEFEPSGPRDDTLLREVYATLDLIDALEDEIATRGVLVEDPKKGLVANPAVPQVRAQRQLLAGLLRHLLPEELTPQQRTAQRASAARWYGRARRA